MLNSIRGLAVLLLALSCAGASTAQTKLETVTVYRHATLIDGTGGPARRDMAVVVKGERIVSVSPDAELKPADLAGARTVGYRPITKDELADETP